VSQGACATSIGEMKLSDLREFVLRNRKRIIVVATLFIFLCIVSVVGYQKFLAPPLIPEEEKLPPFYLVNDIASVTGEVSLSSLQVTDFPGVITAYRAEPLAFSFTKEEAKELAARFGFSGEPRISTSPDGRSETLVFIDLKNQATLAVTTKPRKLTYVVEGGRAQEGTLLDQAAATQKAKEFVGDKDLPLSQLSPFGVRYLISKGNIYFEVEEPTEAEFLEVSFSWLVEGWDLLGESPADTVARVIFDRQGKVVSLKFRFPDLQFTRFGEVKLLSSSEAVAKLKKEGLVVSTSAIGTTTGWSEIADLRSFAPESVRLIFVQPSGATFLYPVYLFEGKGRTTAGVEVKAAAYLLAVSPEYLKAKE